MFDPPLSLHILHYINQEQQIRDTLSMMKERPETRAAVLTDMYEVLCDGLHYLS